MHSGKSIVFNPFEDFRTYNGDLAMYLIIMLLFLVVICGL